MSEENKATNLSSNVLFHFTNSIENLINILEYNFIPHFCPEFSPHYTNRIPREFPKFIYPMVSFCDIPLALIREHLKHYGNYGIGLSKQWGIESCVTPVIYIHQKSTPLSISTAISHIPNFRLVDSEMGKILFSCAIDLFSLMKPFVGYECKKVNNPPNKDTDLFLATDTGKIMSYNDTNIISCHSPNYSLWKISERIFYDEREWRYTPRYSVNNEVRITYPQYISKEYNLPNQFSLPFTPKDIKFIIVNKEEEIDEMISQLERIKLPKYENQIKNLTTHIISADSIKQNISI